MNPENTGTPASPISRYRRTAIVPFFIPSTYTEKKTQNGVNDIGIGPIGIEIGPKMHVNAVITAIVAMTFVLPMLLLCLSIKNSSQL